MRIARVVSAFMLAGNLLVAAVPAVAATATVWPTQFVPVDRSQTLYAQTPHFLEILSGSPGVTFQAPISFPAGKKITKFRFYCGTDEAGAGNPLIAYLNRVKLGNPVVVETFALLQCTSFYSGGVKLVPQEVGAFGFPKTIPAGYRWWVEVFATSPHNKIGAVQVLYE